MAPNPSISPMGVLGALNSHFVAGNRATIARMSAVGSDIESLCSKCGDVWHVIVAMVGDKIAKVQCKECGAYHRYRAPGGTKAAAAKTKRKRAPASKAVAAPTGPEVEPDLSRPIRPYSIRDLFEPGERVDHPTFGIGVVEASREPGKITVFFPQGRKVLAQAKPASTLRRPGR